MVISLWSKLYCYFILILQRIRFFVSDEDINTKSNIENWCYLSHVIKLDFIARSRLKSSIISRKILAKACWFKHWWSPHTRWCKLKFPIIMCFLSLHSCCRNNGIVFSSQCVKFCGKELYILWTCKFLSLVWIVIVAISWFEHSKSYLFTLNNMFTSVIT